MRTDSVMAGAVCGVLVASLAGFCFAAYESAIGSPAQVEATPQPAVVPPIPVPVPGTPFVQVLWGETWEGVRREIWNVNGTCLLVLTQRAHGVVGPLSPAWSTTTPVNCPSPVHKP